MATDNSPSQPQNQTFAAIPMRTIGPVKITGPVLAEEVHVPLATFESPLWPSTARGAAVTCRAGGIRVAIVGDRMSRSLLLQAPDAVAATAFVAELPALREEIAAVVAGTSRYARLLDLHTHQIADLVWLRLEIATGDAAGHNMVTLAADRLMGWLLDRFPRLGYGSISGNLCTDKKVSSVNALLGRGKHVIAEATLSAALCRRYLKTTPEALATLNLRKNLLGSIASGAVQSANAHVANLLLALYLATGQDAANIVEGSQAITHIEARGDDAYVSVTLPNVIVGTVGNGKELPFVRANLASLGCLAERPAGENARRLAAIVGATVLCGELSLLAAQTNPGELMRAHLSLER